jgi:hypothetical protein
LSNLNRKKTFYVIISSVLLGFFLMLYNVVNANVGGLRRDIGSIDSQLRKASDNERAIKEYLVFKQKIGGEIKGIRVEPLLLSADFDLRKNAYKINNIIDSTYRNNGFFFLDGFSLGKSENDDEEGENIDSKKHASIVIKGNKVMFFK